MGYFKKVGYAKKSCIAIASIFSLFSPIYKGKDRIFVTGLYYINNQVVIVYNVACTLRNLCTLLVMSGLYKGKILGESYEEKKGAEVETTPR